MVLDAVLLSIAKISAKRHDGHAVAIFPEMILTASDGIAIRNPTSNYEVWLSGNADYGVIEYEDDKDSENKCLVLFVDLPCTTYLKSFAVRLLGDDANRDDALDLGAGRLFLVEAKRLKDKTTLLSQHMPEAVSQAVVLAEITKYGNLLLGPDIALLISCIQAEPSSFLFVKWALVDICDLRER